VQLGLLVRIACHPARDERAGEPTPPADLEQLAQVDAQGGDEDREQRQAEEDADDEGEGRGVAVLEGLHAATLCIRDVQGRLHRCELERDGAGEQQGAPSGVG